jgi:hypothetical protein
MAFHLLFFFFGVREGDVVDAATAVLSIFFLFEHENPYIGVVS